ncbi:MAG: hypothetical protein ACI9SE_000292 [Neolewinella sp.]|jgi:hypothetical protein
MWQRIEDAFTPNVDELRRAEKDLSRVQVAGRDNDASGDKHQRQATRTGATIASRPTASKRPTLIRLAAGVAILLLLVAGIGWIGKSTVYTKTYDQLTTANLAINALASPDTERSWTSSMLFATKRIKTGLYALHALAISEEDSPEVVAAAQQAWDKLREDTSAATGDGSFNTTDMLVTALDADTPAAEKLRIIDNIEGLLHRLIRAARTANPSKPETKAIAVWKIKHWLLAPTKKAPKIE